MSRHDEITSRYYPPRARWYGRLFIPWFALQRELHLERIHLPAGMAVYQLFPSLLIPGYSFRAFGQRFLGRILLAGYGLMAAVFIAALGYSIAGIAYGLMIALHAVSLCFLALRWIPDLHLGQKLLTALACVVVVGLLIYMPLISYLQKHWFIPLRLNGQVIVVRQSSSTQNIQRGDWIAYNLGEGQHWRFENAYAHGTVYVRAGVDLGPVLALAGDYVEFTTNAFLVNGVAHPLLPNMTTSGEIFVPQKSWFVWPGLDISGHGNSDAGTVSTAVMNNALVSEEQFVGRPFKRWFFRKQTLPKP